jgi:uncharacterized protein (TIGR03086 family)
MIVTVDRLERAIASTRGVLERVTTEQLDNDTPCASWKVRDVVNHIVGGTYTFAATAKNGERPADGGTDAGRDFAAGDRLASFDRGAGEAVAAFNTPGVLDKTLKLPFGDIPAGVFVNIAASDVFQHGWDLAKATGLSTDLDPALATELLEFVGGAIPDAFRGPDGKAPFGAAVTAPESATPADQLAAFLGRTV